MKLTINVHHFGCIFNIGAASWHEKVTGVSDSLLVLLLNCAQLNFVGAALGGWFREWDWNRCYNTAVFVVNLGSLDRLKILISLMYFELIIYLATEWWDELLNTYIPLFRLNKTLVSRLKIDSNYQWKTSSLGKELGIIIWWNNWSGSVAWFWWSSCAVTIRCFVRRSLRAFLVNYAASHVEE